MSLKTFAKKLSRRRSFAAEQLSESRPSDFSLASPCPPLRFPCAENNHLDGGRTEPMELSCGPQLCSAGFELTCAAHVDPSLPPPYHTNFLLTASSSPATSGPPWPQAFSILVRMIGTHGTTTVLTVISQGPVLFDSLNPAAPESVRSTGPGIPDVLSPAQAYLSALRQGELPPPETLDGWMSFYRRKPKRRWTSLLKWSTHRPLTRRLLSRPIPQVLSLRLPGRR